MVQSSLSLKSTIRSEFQRAETHAAGGRDGREEGGERSYYDLHCNLNHSLLHLLILNSKLRFRLWLGIDQRVDLLGGCLGPAERGIAVQLLLRELTGSLGKQLGALHGVLGLHGEVGNAGAVGALLGDRAQSAVDLVVLGELQSVGFDRALEDGQVVDLHGVAVQALLAGAGHEILQDAENGALGERGVVLGHVLRHVADRHRLLVLHARIVLAVLRL